MVLVVATLTRRRFNGRCRRGRRSWGKNTHSIYCVEHIMQKKQPSVQTVQECERSLESFKSEAKGGCVCCCESADTRVSKHACCTLVLETATTRERACCKDAHVHALPQLCHRRRRPGSNPACSAGLGPQPRLQVSVVCVTNTHIHTHGSKV